jgi:hypothetical protein
MCFKKLDNGVNVILHFSKKVTTAVCSGVAKLMKMMIMSRQMLYGFRKRFNEVTGFYMLRAGLSEF